MKGELAVISYSYAYDLVEEDDEVFFVFGAFPEIISSVTSEVFNRMTSSDRADHAADAVVAALQAMIASRTQVPIGDDATTRSASGFVRLSPLQSMKLQLYGVYLANCRTISEFAFRLGKHDTTVRRLLNLRHRSAPAEIEEALRHFGIALEHAWGTVQDPLLERLPG